MERRQDRRRSGASVRPRACGQTEGVSSLLFIGQLLSSIGFTVYSYLVGNWVFTVTNGILTINNMIGIALYFYFERKNKKDGD